MLTRRNFLKLAGSTSGLVLTGFNSTKTSKGSPHVVIVGGGFGGATAAKYIRKLDPRIKVTLIEPKTDYYTCPASNWVLGGFQSVASLKFDFQTLSARYGVTVIKDTVTAIDPNTQSVTTSSKQKIHYQRLILSPGIDFHWNTIEGYDQETVNTIPHAWTAGKQTRLLNQQLQNMRDGGTVIIIAPPNPFRCPPGPYERASMMAFYLKQHKPRSKILILDPKTTFSKQSLFIEGWKKNYHYGTNNSMIEWLSIPDNPVISLDARNRVIETDFGDKYQADVLNLIPPQKAGYIAHRSGLADASGWCPVQHSSSESTIHPNIHVIGDASSYSPIPKSAYAANSEAKVCAIAVVRLLNNKPAVEPNWINTCYSLITPDYGISIAMVYKLSQEGKVIGVEGAGGVTENSDEQTVKLESNHARFWYQSITEDTFL